ncbi:hypothetical protein D3C84_934420 [compost metagenome]
MYGFPLSPQGEQLSLALLQLGDGDETSVHQFLLPGELSLGQFFSPGEQAILFEVMPQLVGDCGQAFIQHALLPGQAVRGKLLVAFQQDQAMPQLFGDQLLSRAGFGQPLP